MSDYPPISAEQIAQDPLARQEAMRRLVRVITDFYDPFDWQRIAEIYDGDNPPEECSRYVREEWIIRQLIHDISDDIKATLSEYGLPYDHDLTERATQPDLIQQVWRDWHDRAHYFRVAGAAFARGEAMTYESILFEMLRQDVLSGRAHSIDIPSLSPADITQDDFMGMVLFGGLHPAETTTFPQWWQGHEAVKDSLCAANADWMLTVNTLHDELSHMPKQLHQCINLGELSYAKTMHSTQQLQRFLSNTKAMESDDISGYKRLSRDAQRVTKFYSTQPLCYNPNGTRNCDVHPVILAMRAHEDELAQHMMANGANAGFLSVPIAASADAATITEFMKAAVKHADAQTFKDCIDWLKAQGVRDPIRVAAKNMNDHFSVDKSDVTALFEAVIRSDHIPSILPKIDYLLGQGLDPFVGEDGAKLLVPLATGHLFRQTTVDALQSAETLNGLVKRGFGQATLQQNRKIEFSPPPSENTIPSSSLFLAEHEAILNVLTPAILTMRQKVEGFANAYDLDPAMWPTRALQPDEWLTPDSLTPEDLTEAWGFGEHVDLLCSSRWHGHEVRFYELFQKTPTHIQHELLQDEHVASYVKRLLTDGMTKYVSSVPKPLQSWTAQVGDRALMETVR